MKKTSLFIFIKTLLLVSFIFLPNHSISEVIKSDIYKPYDKHINISGLKLLGFPNVSDSFMVKLSLIIESTFTVNDLTNKELQKNLFTTFEEKNVIQRIIHESTNMSNIDEDNAPGWDRINDDFLSTDIIWELDGKKDEQVLEIIEHYLHTITICAFPYVFPNQWNYENNESLIRKAMDEAIDSKFYNVSMYKNIQKREPDEYLKIISQEFGYWVILTAWNYKEKYIPDAGDEWTINNLEELKKSLPLSYQLFNETAKYVLTRPKEVLLNDLF